MRAILTLHSIDDSGTSVSMSEDQLESLINAVRKSRHCIVRLAELVSAGDDHDVVAITFDGGLETVHTRALPVLRRLDVQPTLFLVMGRVGLDSRWNCPSPSQLPVQPMMSWEGVMDLKSAGWDIEANTLSHPDLRKVSDDQLDAELEQPIEELRVRLGEAPSALAYPHGYLDARVVSSATKHYAMAVTTTLSPLSGRSKNLHRLPRLETLYFRQPQIHGSFGSPLFSAYLHSRRSLRRWRSDPGETGVV